MQYDLYRKKGVSPAYFVSLFSTAFTPDNICDRIPLLKGKGFRSVQLETFEEEILPLWREGGMTRCLNRLKKFDMECSLYVAHFMGNAFSSQAHLADKKYDLLWEKVLHVTSVLAPPVPLALPLLPFDGEIDEAIKKRGAQRLTEFAAKAAEVKRSLAVEIVPGSLGGTYSSFLHTRPWIGIEPKLGFLLDTGHAHVMGEDIPSLIREMGDRLKGLHMSDNDGNRNASLPPGQGTLNWKSIVESLEAIGYSRFWDLEIAMDSKDLDENYALGWQYLSRY